MTGSSSEPSDQDLSALEPTGTVKVAAALHGISGVVVMLAGLQFLGHALEDWITALQVGLAVAGALQITCAVLVLRNHHPSAIASVPIALACAAGAGAWVWVTVTSMLFSAMAIAAWPLAGVSLLVAPFTIAPTRRAWQAKKRLAGSGLELGF